MSKLRFFIRKVMSGRHKDRQLPVNSESPGAHTIPEKRPLNAGERTLIEWLITNGAPEAQTFRQQLQGVHVVARCSCGCPTVDLAVGDDQASTTGPSQVLANFVGLTPEGNQVGIILHAREGKISELEVYPLVDDAIGSLPKIESLKPF